MTSKNKPDEFSSSGQYGAEQLAAQEAAFIESLRLQKEAERNLRNHQAHSFDSQTFMAQASVGSIRREMADKIEKTKQELEAQVTAKVTEAKKDIDAKAKDTEANLDKKVLEGRNKIIEPLAIFVGLFTFISIGFQVFTQVKEYILWMPILGAVLGGIIIFSGLVVHASSVSADTEKRRIYTGFIVAIGFIILCAAGYYYHQAVNILREEDAKTCIVVTEKENTEGTTYCKLER